MRPMIHKWSMSLQSAAGMYQHYLGQQWVNICEKRRTFY
jgi:hypothetical protein